MSPFLSPGVYVKEVPGSPPIVGVGTSTAAFIGVVDPAVGGFQMPLLPSSAVNRYPLTPLIQPEPVANWGQFETTFGPLQAGNLTLAHAVYGFFNNGGTRCWVTRVPDLTNATAVASALTKLEAIDEVAIVAAPGARQATTQLKLIEHCELLEDRFAVLDGQVTTSITPATIQTVRDSNYAALYFPQITVDDPVSNGLINVPPSGHVAGVYARVDGTVGVHKAPANEIVRGAVGLEYLVTRSEQDALNPEGINAIRNLAGNIKVWGARTLGGDANGELKYVNVRRLMNYLRESIDEGTQFVVFEPNAKPLWQRIIRSVSAFLTNVWRDGALFGDAPEEAFYVKCDESTNPPEVRDLGRVVTEIGVAIVRPAEFVIFRISQGPALPT